VSARFFIAVALVAVACTPDDPQIVGRWQNGTKQYLVVEANLTGRLTQQAACSPDLMIRVHRDPLDAYALFFVPNQSVYFPLVQRPLFEPNEFFCASKDSTAMCNFCRLEDSTHLACEQTEQKITGRGSTVTHDCTWVRVETSSTSTQAVSCPMVADAGTGCTATALIAPDASVADGGEPDAN
jgi:hypothetical protein